MQMVGTGAGPMGAGQMQPWNQVLFPADPNVRSLMRSAMAGWRPMSAPVARALPAVGRAVALISGMAMQMPLDDYRGIQPLPRPRLLEQPDPDESRAWFVEVCWEDYLLNGNAVQYVTSRDSDGWPATTLWLPAALVTLTPDVDEPREVVYWFCGTELDRDEVIHVKRGADPMFPARGVGVVEQYLDVLDKVRDQHRYEHDMLDGAAVPSVAVITPNPQLSQVEADEGKTAWLEKYGGTGREPAILPFGTQVIPLSWSPSDAQLVEARQLSLTDVANMFNLDPYWTGAPASSHTYRSPGPMYLNLLRQTVGPIAEVFEDVWSSAWVPRGRRVRFDRKAVLADDMQTTVQTLTMATRAGLMTIEEARAYMGLQPQKPVSSEPAPSTTSPVATVTDDSIGTEEEAS